ncbi:hypothetical protein [Microbacterium schleiferi]|uniref:hypothetical protein n=1 Tax=Microbacterium schleiferi TaxID=69362 RepID=UPI001D17CB44|nr:hypothetical protein [Microbacterium schleiferi]MCC4266279.1 hypothetical protein [Microbacterium schleiferi]
MNDFTASNGIGVEINDEEQIVFAVGNRPITPIWTNSSELKALREFFRAEEDERLGRWRYPENPDYVVYLRPDGQVMVLVESSGQTVYRYRGEADELRDMRSRDGKDIMPATRAAEAYFDAHPEPLDMPDGIYMVNKTFHPYERLVQRRRGEWLHLYRGYAPQHETHTAEQVARIAAKEGRLTPLVQVPEPDTTGGAS